MKQKRMFDTKTEQRKFWAIFEEVLEEKGRPFEICYKNHLGEIEYWANVNRGELANEFGRQVNTIDLSFLARRGLFRINLYINTLGNVRDTILNNKETVEKMIGKPVVWEFGTKNKNLKLTKKPIEELSRRAFQPF